MWLTSGRASGRKNAVPILFDEALAVTKIKSDTNFFFRYAKKSSICKSSIGPILNPKSYLLTNDKSEMCSLLLDKFNSVFSIPMPNMFLFSHVSQCLQVMH